jgi:transcriptional regulator with PAS, ATPase and Fis domain
LGETGTGKELFAKLIHRLSNRRNGPLQMVNCAAIPEALAEDTLFGHVRGAFTGANGDRPGVFECAHGGTLFLDELATLPLALQAKLLRVLNDSQVQRLGTQTPRPVDVRIVAATKPNLSEEIAAGRFLADLYWRLEVAVITLPPLRERREEIESLACWLLRRINKQRQRPRQLTKDALLRLEQHTWPGNVRELSNVLVRSVLFSRSEILGPEDILITPKPVQDPFAGLPEPGSPGFRVDDILRDVKTHLYKRALDMSDGNQTAAAKLLGVTKQAVSKFDRGQENNED